MKKEKSDLMNLKKGSLLVCVSNPMEGVEFNSTYTFLGYDETSVPKNDYSAVMTWYPKKPIWTPSEYEQIRFNFMMIKLHGIKKPVWLRDFQKYTFTD